MNIRTRRLALLVPAVAALLGMTGEPTSVVPAPREDAGAIARQDQLVAMVREAIAWLDRTLPLAARFPKGSVFREDRQQVPPEALRETIINAVVHRDLGLASGYVAIAVFDDRIEVRSVGELPFGLRAEQLSEEHPSRPRNPDLAGAVHRTGAIAVWGAAPTG